MGWGGWAGAGFPGKLLLQLGTNKKSLRTPSRVALDGVGQLFGDEVKASGEKKEKKKTTSRPSFWSAMLCSIFCCVARMRCVRACQLVCHVCRCGCVCVCQHIIYTIVTLQPREGHTFCTEMALKQAPWHDRVVVRRENRKAYMVGISYLCYRWQYLPFTTPATSNRTNGATSNQSYKHEKERERMREREMEQ